MTAAPEPGVRARRGTNPFMEPLVQEHCLLCGRPRPQFLWVNSELVCLTCVHVTLAPLVNAARSKAARGDARTAALATSLAAP